MIFFIDFFLCFFFLSLLLQCKFAISTLLPLLSFSYFMTPYDAQASSAFSALIFFLNYMKCSFFRYYTCVFDINLFILNEDLFICQQPTPVASNTDASKITPMFASQLARDVMMASP